MLASLFNNREEKTWELSVKNHANAVATYQASKHGHVTSAPPGEKKPFWCAFSKIKKAVYISV